METAPEDIESVEEFAPEEEPSAERYLFDAQIQRSKESYDALANSVSSRTKKELPAYDNLHIRQKFFFSYFRPEAYEQLKARCPMPSSIAYKTPTIDVHGLSIEGKTFDYSPDFRKTLHRALISEVVGNAENEEEAIERLAGANADFRSRFIQRAEGNTRRDIQKKYAQKEAEIREKYRSKYANVSLQTIRCDYLAAIKPEYDRKRIENIASNTAEVQPRLEAGEKRIESYCSSYKEVEKKIARLEEKGREADAEIKKREAKIEDKNLDEDAKKRAKKKLERLKEEEENLRRIRIATCEGRLRAIREHINESFCSSDNYVAKCQLAERVAAAMELPVDDYSVATKVSSIVNGNNPFDSSLAEAIKDYHAAVREHRNHDYYADIVPDGQSISQKSLVAGIRKKQLAAFVEYNRIYTGLTPEESNNLYLHDFLKDLSQKKKAYVMERSGFSAEEYDKITGGRVDCVYFRHDAVNLNALVTQRCLDGKKTKKFKTERANDMIFASCVLHRRVMEELAAEYDMSSLNAPQEVSKTVFRKSFSSDDNYIETKKEGKNGVITVSPRLRSGLNRDEAIEQLLSTMSPEDEEQSAEYRKHIDDAIEEIKRRAIIDIRFSDAAARFGTTLCRDDEIACEEELRVCKNEKEESLRDLPKAIVEKHFAKEMQNFSQRIFGEGVSETFVLPTGFIIRHNDGHCQAISADVTSDIISQRLDGSWGQLWSNYLRSNEFNNPGYDKCIIAKINENIENDFEKYADFVDDDTKRVFERCKELGIDSQATVGLSGSFVEQLSDFDCDNYEHCRDKFGRYFKIIDTTAGGISGIKDDALMRSIKEYLASGAQASMEVCSNIASGGKSTISLKRYSAIAGELGQQVADSCIINDISCSAFSRNEEKIMPILKQLLGDRLNISLVTAMRLTGKQILAPATRQKVAMRAIFAANYGRFLRGEEIEDSRLAEFIRRVDELEYGKAEA